MKKRNHTNTIKLSKHRVLILSAALLVSHLSFAANNMANVIASQKAREKNIQTAYSNQVQKEKAMVKERMKQSDAQAFFKLVNEQAKKMPLNQVAEKYKPQPTVLIFVSLSMPKDSLLGWLEEAKRINAPVVLRGFVDNSLKATKKAIYPFAEKTKSGFAINPLWFRDFDIEQVPAVVVVNHDSCRTNHDCANEGKFDVVYGDTTLTYALKQIEQRGDQSASMSKALLDDLNLKTENENHGVNDA